MSSDDIPGAGLGDRGNVETERGMVGDAIEQYRYKYEAEVQPGKHNASKKGLGAFLFNELHGVVHKIGAEINERVTGQGNQHSHTHTGVHCADGMHDTTQHRYGSFARPRIGNDIKWYVDGCGYMWAVSKALEEAKTTIWILDWWLSPELYLRRPPSKNEQYRVDRMLQAAAQRGVKVNIIVYKEVTQALTLPGSPDQLPRNLIGFGLNTAFASLESVEKENPLIDPPIAVSSSHTKHALEDLHPNIAVFRHPDHLPDAQTLQSSFWSAVKNISLTAKTASNLPEDALKALFGMNDDVILYWAHHEKLLLIDGEIAFMGGLDLCYGRWDTNQHPLADCHPTNLEDIVFPGQDYNNARIMDFQDVAHWQQNKLDRKTSSRMVSIIRPPMDTLLKIIKGWSDVSVCLTGPVVEDLRSHFVDRWNFIYDEKYNVRKDVRYSRLATQQTSHGAFGGALIAKDELSRLDDDESPPTAAHTHAMSDPQSKFARQTQKESTEGFSPSTREPQNDDIVGGTEEMQPSHRQKFGAEARDMTQRLRNRYEDHKSSFKAEVYHAAEKFQNIGVPCQIVRSCTRWSHGVPTEHSVANAYISIIENSQHFIYIENQFFITATCDEQKPVRNKIGAALVKRILRAAGNKQKFKVIVVIPAVPGFAGDLRDDASLGTRAIMQYQYNSINRGGHSIMECIASAGYDPREYIRFYNLRNYDRINVSNALKESEQKSGVTYDAARTAHDQEVEKAPNASDSQTHETPDLHTYQRATDKMNKNTSLYAGKWDSVSECYMKGGLDIRNVPWDYGDYSELDAFVSEELYVHTKVIIADDRTALIGSANLNDRSQLGNHDSEIAIVVEDTTPIESKMNGIPYHATRFAATLRRQLFRKHLGLIPAQDMEHPDQNFQPVGTPNAYDYGSPEDNLVADPMADGFLNFWNSRARINTEVFGRAFHPVPHDSVRTWKQYDEFYDRFFKAWKEVPKKPSMYILGHVVAEEFSPGEEGVRELKEELSKIKGTLVEMPLLFLIDEELATEGLELNAFTEEVYT